jgi:hypothetical protein
MPDPEQLKRLSQSINNFIKGNLNLGKDDICLTVDRGGLGMIDVEEFLCGLQCSWIKKCINNCTIDTWRYDINKDTVASRNPRIFKDENPPVYICT